MSTVPCSDYQGFTVGEVVLQLRKDFSKVGIPEARLEAELLVAHAMCVERAYLLAEWEGPVPPSVPAILGELAERRLRREPFSYLVGWREFYGLRFAVRPGVLIPRPETEIMVEAALKLAVQRYGGMPLIADVGCGCGAITVAVSVNLPAARVYAIDNASIPIEVSRENFRAHGVEERVSLLGGDLLAPLPRPVDILIANLPYVRGGDLDTLQPEVLWEPRNALSGGPDGLTVIRRLLDQAPGNIRAGGAILLECDPRQMDRIMREVKDRFPGSAYRTIQDLSALDRVVEVLL